MERKKDFMNKVIAILLTILIIITSCILYKLCNPTINILEKTSNIDQGTDLLAADITADWDLNKVNIVYDTAGVPVPVPKGFVGSEVEGEHTVNSGFVIYETEGEVNDENKDTMQRTVNQFVWVPIYDINEMYGCDIDGVAHGKLYEFNSNERIPLNWSEDSNGVMRILNPNSYKEPLKQTLSANEIPKYLSEEALVYNKDFSNMISSVKQYGGFYIGRYETGDISMMNPKVVKGNTDIRNVECSVMKTRCENISNNANVKTMMIFGCQWDAMLEWLVDTGSKTYSEIGSNSGSWGNYSYSGGEYVTGSSETYKANNIYNLAGNVYEWTQEIYRSSDPVGRGGNTSNHHPASHRWNANYGGVGCRSTLYIVQGI